MFASVGDRRRVRCWLAARGCRVYWCPRLPGPGGCGGPCGWVRDGSRAAIRIARVAATVQRPVAPPAASDDSPCEPPAEATTVKCLGVTVTLKWRWFSPRRPQAPSKVSCRRCDDGFVRYCRCFRCPVGSALVSGQQPRITLLFLVLPSCPHVPRICTWSEIAEVC